MFDRTSDGREAVALRVKDSGRARLRRAGPPTLPATERAQSHARAGRAARWKPARIREHGTPRSKAGKGSRMRGLELRAGRHGEGEVEFPRGNLTR